MISAQKREADDIEPCGQNNGDRNCENSGRWCRPVDSCQRNIARLTCGAKYRGRRALRIIISQSGVTTFSFLHHDYQLTPAQCAHVHTNLQTRQYR